MRKIFLFTLFALSFTFHATGQENEVNDMQSLKGLSLDIGSGIYGMKMRDELFSPLIYRGFSFAVPQLKLQWRGKKIQLFSNLITRLGILDQNVKSDWIRTPEILYGWNSDVGFLYNVKQWKPGKRNLWLGLNTTLKWDILMNSRMGNSALNYNFILGSSILGRLEFPFGWKAKDLSILNVIHLHRKSRRLLLAWQLEYPLAGLLVRPSFDGIMYPAFDNPDNGSFWDEENINGYILNPLYIRSQTELSYILKNRNRLKITYHWNYFHVKKYDLSDTFISYGLLFSFVFAF